MVHRLRPWHHRCAEVVLYYLRIPKYMVQRDLSSPVLLQVHVIAALLLTIILLFLVVLLPNSYFLFYMYFLIVAS